MQTVLLGTLILLSTAISYPATYHMFPTLQMPAVKETSSGKSVSELFLKQPVVAQTGGEGGWDGLVRQIVNSFYFPYALTEADNSYVCHGEKIQGAVAETLPLLSLFNIQQSVLTFLPFFFLCLPRGCVCL